MRSPPTSTAPTRWASTAPRPAAGFDLERIEVARGPQGTLNGRNSIAGAINVVTKGPTDHWDAELMGEVTDISQQRLNGALGGPLGEGPFSFRLTAGNHTGDGRQENVGPGGDHDAPDQTFYSPQPLRAETERFSARLRWSSVEDRGTPRGFVQLSNVDRTIAGYSRDRYYLWETPNPGSRSELWLRSPRVELPRRDPEQGGVQLPRLQRERERFRHAPGRLAGFEVPRHQLQREQRRNGCSCALRDADYTNRVPINTPPGDPGIGGDPNSLDHTLTTCTPGQWGGLCPDGTVQFSNSFYDLPFEYEENSQELLFRSSYAGDFNFIGGLFMYDNQRSGTIHRHDLQIPYRFGTPPTNRPGGSRRSGASSRSNNCQDVLTKIVEGFGIGTTDPAGDEEGL